jgi:succinyl-diaminopimelate desuccinylase
MTIREQLVDRLTRERDDIIRICQELVRIPSENPPGDTRDVLRYITDLLSRHGLEYEAVAPVQEWPNLVASFDGANPGRHLVLNGHMDVFPAGDPALWADGPFSGTLRDGKIFGRGINDMKAGTLASVLTFIYLSDIREHLAGKLTLTCVSDEETFGQYGARYLIENRPEVLGDCVLNGEPSTPNTVRFGEKGLIWIELNVNTKGGHGGYPQVSANAIKIASAIIGELEQLSEITGDMPGEVEDWIDAGRDAFDAMLGTGATDYLKRVSVNIGMTEGGEKVNMIAAHSRTEVDIRCPVGVSTDQALRRFDEIVGRYPEASYRIINQSEPNYVDPRHQMVDILQRNAEAVRGIRPEPNISLGGTDCRLWRQRGIPAFIYGPTPYNMGSPDEYVTVDDLLGTVSVHVLSAFDYLSGDSNG